MADHDASPPKNPRDLLGELERIKDTLERGERPTANGDEGYPDIPLLSDIVSDADELLDIDEIFDEPAAAAQNDADSAEVEDGEPTLDLNHLDELDIDFPSFTLDVHSDGAEPEPTSGEDMFPSDATADLWPESLPDATEPAPLEQTPDLPAPEPPAQPVDAEPAATEPVAEQPAEEPTAAEQPAEEIAVGTNTSREQLVDALVAEFLPQIEAELRRQLQQADIEDLARRRDHD